MFVIWRLFSKIIWKLQPEKNKKILIFLAGFIFV